MPRRYLLSALAWPALAVLVCSMGWSALYTHLREERHNAERIALNQAAALARSYAQQLNRTVESIDQILLHVRYEWELTHGQLTLESLKEIGLFPPTSLWNIAVVDGAGIVKTSAIDGGRGIDVNGRQYFEVHRDNLADTLAIGDPMYSQISKRMNVPFSRRLSEPNGKFNGAALISVVPGYLTAGYDSTTLGAYGMLAVVGDDRKLRVARIGQNASLAPVPALEALPLVSTLNGSALAGRNGGFADGRARFLGWDTTWEFPLVAVVGLDERTAMAPYWDSRDNLLHTATLASAAVAALSVAAALLSLRLAWRKRQWEMNQLSYRLATEGGSEGFYIARPLHDAQGNIVDFLLVDCNRRGASMLRERREELIGKAVSHIYTGSAQSSLLHMLRMAMQSGFYEHTVEVARDSPLVPRWVHLTIVRSDDSVAITLRDVSDTKAHIAELERRSSEDALTGLPNRYWVQTYLPQTVARAAKQQQQLAILFIDLDGFKAVNDTAGHAGGDELLRNAAARLKGAVRPHDHVARWGGDEFVVILEPIAGKDDAAHVAGRIRQAFRKQFRLLHGVHTVGTSVGISLFPGDAEDAETLIKHADVAMYSVKNERRGNYRFYDQQYHHVLQERQKMVAELRQAIERGQFLVYYQPRIAMSTGDTASLEALVRWQHPVRGTLEPLEFIPLAEETGLISGIGRLVIEQVCAQLEHWAQQREPLVPVSINVSARQFSETDVAQILALAFGRHHVDPRLIEIELTESSLMADTPQIAAALSAMRDMGVKLLVDDFGTGYSSLSQLQKLDFDVLKVDRAFTAEIDRTQRGMVLFKSIVTMAHALGMRVVAEGVENVRQIEILKGLHCDELQGFFFSKPLPPADQQPLLPKSSFVTLLADQTA